MAEIHHTTLVPSKLELLRGWLPAQPWYLGSGLPELTRAGGFRLDDPAGAVGLEFLFVADSAGPRPAVYQVPMTYRGAAVPGADAALIGTTEHGVLGRRWIYDGARDPVLVRQLLALVQGRVVAQDQNLSDTTDPSVTAEPGPPAEATASSTTASTTASTGSDPTSELTAITVEVGSAPPIVLELVRVLGADPAEAPRTAYVAANWTEPDGEPARGPIVRVG